jgi:hypothetical protein
MTGTTLCCEVIAFSWRDEAVDAAHSDYANSWLTLYADKGDVTSKVDQEGRFELPLAPGLYDVFIAAGAFLPQCKVVEITADHAATFKVMMKPDRLHLQQSAH